MTSPHSDAIEIIPDRLYWMSTTIREPQGTPYVHYFSIDSEFVYEAFFQDFGPLNLGMTYRYCRLLEDKLKDKALQHKLIVHYCANTAQKRPNAAYLIGAFQVIVQKKTADEAYKPFQNIYPPFLPFRDATYGICTYHLTILDCLKGLEHAVRLGWLDYKTFDIDEYEYYEKIENGDLNWIIPKMFAAFSGPSSTSTDEEGFQALTPEDYLPVFEKLGIKLVIRLNKKQYDRKRFASQNVNHVDLYFLDGSCPTREIIHKFLDITEREIGSRRSAVGVHCKAGLGRTGTLIGAFAVKNYRFLSAHWIGWNRICRPGSVLGPQQHFLIEIQSELLQMGSMKNLPQHLPLLEEGGQDIAEPIQTQLKHLSLSERRVADQGELGQGERLVLVKRQHCRNDAEHERETNPTSEVEVEWTLTDEEQGQRENVAKRLNGRPDSGKDRGSNGSGSPTTTGVAGAQAMTPSERRPADKIP